MIVTTFSSIPGKQARVLAPVSVNIVRATHGGKDITMKVKDIFGGRVGGLEKLFNTAQKEAIEQAKEQCRELGGHALLDMRFEYTTIGERGGLLGVHLLATAVKLTEIEVQASSGAASEQTSESEQRNETASRRPRFGEFHDRQREEEEAGLPRFGDFGAPK